MNLTIELAEDESTILTAKAPAQGLSTEAYARRVLELDLVPDWLRESWETSQATGLGGMSAEEIDAEIAAGRQARRFGKPEPSA
jgi:hypothetical protein